MTKYKRKKKNEYYEISEPTGSIDRDPKVTYEAFDDENMIIMYIYWKKRDGYEWIWTKLIHTI